ncbi:MAG: carboxypeptidase-like regulatory domain-containing protein [Sphingomonas sp.]|jgi:hypothetical protein
MADTEILFPKPCHEDWDAMRRDGHSSGAARACDACGKQVHDLSLYTPEEADALLLGGKTPACVRATILPDGRVATLPSRAGKMLMAAIATPALLLATAGAATGPGTGAIVGSVSTAGTPVHVAVVAGEVRRSARVNADGTYRFDQLPPGEYKLVFSSAKSPSWTIAKVAVRANHVTVRNSYDPAMSPRATMGVPPPPTVVLGEIPMPVRESPHPKATAPERRPSPAAD